MPRGMPQDMLGMAGGKARGHSLPVRPYSGLGIAGDGLLGAGSGVGWSISVGAVVYVPRAYTDDSGTLPHAGCHTVSLQRLTFASPRSGHSPSVRLASHGNNALQMGGEEWLWRKHGEGLAEAWRTYGE
jgi:hypothetical protein